MAIENGYITLEDFKLALDITGTKHDASIERAIAAASRQIDKITDRVFYPTASEARYFRGEYPTWMYIDDARTVTAVETDTDGDGTYETTWLTTDWFLERESPEHPYNMIKTTPLGTYAFVRQDRAVKITGTWGWDEAPDDIKQATLLLATRLFKRKDAPFGIMGFGDLGQVRVITNVDPDVRSLTRPYRRLGTW